MSSVSYSPASPPTVRAQTAAHHAHQRTKSGGNAYTLTHAGHQVRIGPVAFWIVVGTLIVMAMWTVATGTYFAFKDDVLVRLIGRQAQMQFAYEDRLADMRTQVDRVTSRQMLDQEQVEKKLEALLRRQTTLEQRTATLSGDSAPAQGNALRGTRGPSPSVKPSPINDTVIFAVPPDREARLQSREVADSQTRLAATSRGGGVGSILSRVAQSLDRVDQRQASALAAMEENIESKTRRIQGVLADLGLGKAPAGGDITGAVGGPYVPLRGSRANTFEFQVQRVNYARNQLDRLTRSLDAVPVRKPIFGEVDMSSPFGARMDPFLKGPAIHTGIDIRGDTGDPVRATATGKVVTAGWNGGYGNMVEIDHGNGLSTRYGHMSKILVRVGEHVSIGQTVGLIGSTGRSTGPHLHYETRVDEDPVNPQKFLRAGVRLGSGT